MSWVNNTIRRDNRASFDEVIGKPKAVIIERTNRRYILSIFALVFGIIMFYVSAHYVGAFVHINTNIGITMASINESVSHNKVYLRVANIAGESDYKRVYLRNEQALHASYIIPKGSTLEIKVIQCKQRPVVEVFKCFPKTERIITIKDKMRGSTTIRVAQPGFYYFTETVTQIDNMPPENKGLYTLLWKRI